MKAPLFLMKPFARSNGKTFAILHFFKLFEPYYCLPLAGRFTGFGPVRFVCSGNSLLHCVFMAGLRQAHDGFHAKLGLSARWTHAFLFVFSLLMVIPLHAIRWIHLRHHAHPLAENDVEGMCARMSWWQALIAGPFFSMRMIFEGLVYGEVGHGFGSLWSWPPFSALLE